MKGHLYDARKNAARSSRQQGQRPGFYSPVAGKPSSLGPIPECARRESTDGGVGAPCPWARLGFLPVFWLTHDRQQRRSSAPTPPVIADLSGWTSWAAPPSRLRYRYPHGRDLPRGLADRPVRCSAGPGGRDADARCGAGGILLRWPSA